MTKNMSVRGLLEGVGTGEEKIKLLLETWPVTVEKEVILEKGAGTAYINLEEKRIHVSPRWLKKLGENIVGTLIHEIGHEKYFPRTLAVSYLDYEILGEYSKLFEEIMNDVYIGLFEKDELKEGRKRVLLQKLNDDKKAASQIVFSTSLCLGKYEELDKLDISEEIKEIVNTLGYSNWNVPLESEPDIFELAVAFKNIVSEKIHEKDAKKYGGDIDVPPIEKLNKTQAAQVMNQLGKSLQKATKKKNSQLTNAIYKVMGDVSKNIGGVGKGKSSNNIDRTGYIESYKEIAKAFKIEISSSKQKQPVSMFVGYDKDGDLSKHLNKVLEDPNRRQGYVFYVPSTKIHAQITDPEGKEEKPKLVVIMDSSGSMGDPADIEEGYPSLAVISAFSLLQSFSNSPTTIINFSGETHYKRFEKPNDETFAAVINYQEGGTVLETDVVKKCLNDFENKYFSGETYVLMITDMKISNEEDVEQFFNATKEYASKGLILHIGGKKTEQESYARFGGMGIIPISDPKDLLNVTEGFLRGVRHSRLQPSMYTGAKGHNG